MEERDCLADTDEDRIKTLCKDVGLLKQANDDLEFLQVPNNGRFGESKQHWQALAKVTKKQIGKVHSFESSVEHRNTRAFGPKNKPTFRCETCGKMFQNNHDRTSHKVAAHNFRSQQRQLVQPVSAKGKEHRCLLCRAVFKDKRGAQSHIDRVCAPKFSAEQLAAAIAALTL